MQLRRSFNFCATRGAFNWHSGQQMGFEFLLPFGIIGATVSLMGGLQHVIHKGFTGKVRHLPFYKLEINSLQPRRIGMDQFDWSLQTRDERLEEAAKQPRHAVHQHQKH